PGYESTTWVSIFAPAGTPRAIIDQLNTEFGKALRDPGIASRLSGLTYDATYGTPEELTQRMKSDYAKIGKMYRQIGVTIDYPSPHSLVCVRAPVRACPCRCSPATLAHRPGPPASSRSTPSISRAVPRGAPGRAARDWRAPARRPRDRTGTRSRRSRGTSI